LDIESYLKQYPLWASTKWVPIAGDGCGNHYVMPTQSEFGPGYPIMFIDVGQAVESPSYLVASDIEHFVVGILQKELGPSGWPFNRDQVVSFDPRIVTFQGIRFAWEAA
jgi:cell wall assembly regulator SMI1